MTSHTASMVSSGVACDMKVMHILKVSRGLRVPKAQGEGKPHRGSASAIARPGIVMPYMAYRQSRSREHAGSAAAARAEETQTHRRNR